MIQTGGGKMLRLLKVLGNFRFMALIAIVAAGAGLTTLVKDTSVKAFIPAGHEALLSDAKAADVFGLSDTIAVAVISTDGNPVFIPETLALIAEITDALSALDNIRADRIASLATESSISGADGAIFVDPYIDAYALDAESASDSRSRWESMRPHRGTLVSDDASGAVIMAELVDAHLADATYLSVLDIVNGIDSDEVELHVAGPGAVSGYLSRYIDQDARKLQPLVFVLVLGNEIDNIFRQGFFFSDRHTFPDRFFRPGRISAAFFGNTSYIGHHVVGDLVRHGIVDLLAAGADRMRRTVSALARPKRG